MRDENEKPINEIATALAKAQGQMTYAKKDSLNPHFKSRYADLAAVWDAIRVPLSSNGIAVVQQVGTRENSVSITTRLVHSSGQEFSSTCTFPVAQPTPQAFGSVISYAKRYSLAAMVGVAADIDDDANAASEFTPQQQPPPKYVERKPAGKEELVSQLTDSLGFAREVRDATDKVTAVSELENLWPQYTDTPAKLSIARPIFAERKQELVSAAKKNVAKMSAEAHQ